FIKREKLPADVYQQEVSPKVAEYKRSLKKYEETLTNCVSERETIDNQFNELVGLTNEEALNKLRSESNNYQVVKGKLDKVVGQIKSLLNEAKCTVEDFDKEESLNMVTLLANHTQTKDKFTGIISDNNEVLSKLDRSISADNLSDELIKVSKLISNYKSYQDKKTALIERNKKRNAQIEDSAKLLDEKVKVLKDIYNELPLMDRLARIRKDISSVQNLKNRISECRSNQDTTKKKINEYNGAVNGFIEKYLHFETTTDNPFNEIVSKADSFRDKLNSKKQLEQQVNEASAELETQLKESNSNVEIQDLRKEIEFSKKRQDALLMEYQEKSDFIRNADTALEAYPDTKQEIKQLYDERQKIQGKVATLKKTMQLIEKAKGNLADRYLGRLENTFNEYMKVWMENKDIKGILDIDFNLSIQENGKEHIAQGYSTGYCDMLDFCMRLALVDTLFENEEPFLILDDPFVNLDEDRLEKALELLNYIGADKQIMNFVFHPVKVKFFEVG
ncbi:MAG: hypothetical protein HUJ56_11880, partial [Erysipelotrichaceae bacterium]|nr:hypothetical protein [Erysipelotrichaceae bacterium]